MRRSSRGAAANLTEWHLPLSSRPVASAPLGFVESRNCSLDGAPSSISVLSEIVEAVGGRCEVLFDSGVRSGQDIAKALALGARGALIGKAFLYALAAAGEAGVTKAIEIMRSELRVTLALTGTSSIDAVGPHILRVMSSSKS